MLESAAIILAAVLYSSLTLFGVIFYASWVAVKALLLWLRIQRERRQGPPPLPPPRPEFQPRQQWHPTPLPPPPTKIWRDE